MGGADFDAVVIGTDGTDSTDGADDPDGLDGLDGAGPTAAVTLRRVGAAPRWSPDEALFRAGLDALAASRPGLRADCTRRMPDPRTPDRPGPIALLRRPISGPGGPLDGRTAYV
ncbi:hypothetical protein [Streptomyces sp. NPDC088557]|uniref:hypothetical protein n=1 Tax=Streptomyces sp. NPDC088557 TaxID=3365867 RepID=UPI00381C402C